MCREHLFADVEFSAIASGAIESHTNSFSAKDLWLPESEIEWMAGPCSGSGLYLAASGVWEYIHSCYRRLR